MSKSKAVPRRKGKAIYFRVPDNVHETLARMAKSEKRRTVPDFMYAKALELAETAEAAR